MRLILLSILLFITFYGFSQEVERDYDIHSSMIENKGQWNDDVLFKASMSGGNVWLQKKKMVYHLINYGKHQDHHGFHEEGQDSIQVKQHVIHANFVGVQKATEIVKSKPSIDYFNYFLGNSPDQWASDVKGFQEVRMTEIYSGIDLQYHQEKGQLKYEFVVQPNASPKQISIEFVGQDKIKIDRGGRLILYTEIGQVIEENPFAYQIINGKIIEVKCDFLLENNLLTFSLGQYDVRKELVIDPTLVFATYSGSTSNNFGMTATYGHDGSAYAGGTIFGNRYPIPDSSVFDPNSNFTVQAGSNGITDIVISKYSADGTTMIWSTYLGGGSNSIGTETAQSLICDKSDNVYVLGVTSSTNFPVVNAFQSAHGGGQDLNFSSTGTNFGTQGTDLIISKISDDGKTLMGSTYFGGADNDGVNYNLYGKNLNYSGQASYDSLTRNYGDQYRGEIMLGQNDNVIVASSTRSLNFPIQNAIQSSLVGGQDAVLFSLDKGLTNLFFSTYYGGTKDDAGNSVKVDSSYNIVLGGGTCSNDLIGTTNGLNPNYLGGKADGFVLKLTPDGSTIINSTYIGTSNYDQVYFVEINIENEIFIMGQSAGGEYPVKNAKFSNPNSNHFISKLDSNLTVINKSTVFGASNTEQMMSPSAFLVDVCGEIFVSGWGAKLLSGAEPLVGFPTTSDAFQPAPGGNTTDFYLMVIDRSFDNLIYGTYMGGNQASEHVDGGTSRFDKNGIVYQSVCGGCSGFSDFPTTPGAWSSTNNSTGCNNLVFKFDFQVEAQSEFTIQDTTLCIFDDLQLTNTSTSANSFYWDFGNGIISTEFEPVVSYDMPGDYTVLLIILDTVCLTTDTSRTDIHIGEELRLNHNDSVFLCQADSIYFIVDTEGSANTFHWSSTFDFLDTLNASLGDSILGVFSTTQDKYYIKIANDVCDKIDSVQIFNIQEAHQLLPDLAYCKGEIIDIELSNSLPFIGFTYLWSPDSVIVGDVTAPIIQVKAETDQYVFVNYVSDSGCVYRDSFFVDVFFIDETTLLATANPIYLPQGGTAVLNAQPSGYVYNWLPNQGLSNPSGQTTSAKVENTTTYTVTYTDGYCIKSKSVLVETFEFVCDNPKVYIPNAFSPNGDGENDQLIVRSLLVSEMEFKVFDRWGGLVFESYSTDVGWDGKLKGKLLDPDVYDYFLKVVCVDGQENIIKGNVTLLR
ncbi:MAG: gliding motility-associated-like protein [Lentimonas sp.]|jgi:gliding motility-associated-like protein